MTADGAGGRRQARCGVLRGELRTAGATKWLLRPGLTGKVNQELAWGAASPTTGVNGASMRSVDDLVRAMVWADSSNSQVSWLSDEIDECFDACLTRPIRGKWPSRRFDSTCLPLHQSP